MSTKIVMRFTCNICGTQAEPEDLTGAPRKVNPPKDWSEVVHFDKRKSSDIHICPPCTNAVKDGNVTINTKKANNT